MVNIRFSYEVFGNVIGVGFREWAKLYADKMGLKGYMMSTENRTLVGEVEGPKDKIGLFRYWLQELGSPGSNITECDIKDVTEIKTFKYKKFGTF